MNPAEARRGEVIYRARQYRTTESATCPRETQFLRETGFLLCPRIRYDVRMTRRSRAREVALQLLFQDDHNSTADRVAAERFVRDRLRDASLHDFCLGLYDGVRTHRAAIDQRLAEAAENWRLPR